MGRPKKKTLIILGIIVAWILFGKVFVTDDLLKLIYTVLTVLFTIITLIVLAAVSTAKKTFKVTRNIMNDSGMGSGGTTKRLLSAQSPFPEDASGMLKFEMPQVSTELLAEISKARNKSRIAFVVCVICFVGTIISAITQLEVIAYPMVIIGVILFFSAGGFQGQANKIFKDNIVQDALSKAFDNLEFKQGEALNLFKLQIFPRQSKEIGGDYISAKYKKRAFKQSENEIIEVTITTNDEGDEIEQCDTLFFGRFMELAYNTSVDAKTRVISRDFKNTREERKGWEKIKTELDAFNTAFDVYTTDPVSAMTALVPPMLESIVRLNAVINRPTAFCFQDDTLYILISMSKGEDPFETFASQGNEKAMRKLGGDIQFIRDILDNLYTK